jgi:hypothetical protein
MATRAPRSKVTADDSQPDTDPIRDEDIADALPDVAADAGTAGDTETVQDGVTVPVATVEANGHVSVNPALISVPVDMLGELIDVPVEEWSSHPLTKEEIREPAQLILDADVLAAHLAWTEAGKPVPAKSPRKSRKVSPEFAPSIRRMLHNSGTFLNLEVVISEPVHDFDGREIITFSARDKKGRPAKGAHGARADLTDARTWLRANGHPDVKARGRIDEELLALYNNRDQVQPLTEDEVTVMRDITAQEMFGENYADLAPGQQSDVDAQMIAESEGNA